MTDKQQSDDRIGQEIRAMATDGKAACKGLLDLAQRSGETPGRIGQICNEMDIRVAACQLGCFK